MKGRVSGYRLVMATLLFVMICSMCFFPMLKGSKFGIGNISYVRSIGSIWREASFSQTSGSAVGTVIWMLIAFILIVISLVLILIPDETGCIYIEGFHIPGSFIPVKAAAAIPKTAEKCGFALIVFQIIGIV